MRGYFSRIRKGGPDLSKVIPKMVKNRHVDGLVEIVQGTDVPAAFLRQALDGLVEVATPEAWDALGRILVEESSQTVELVIETLAAQGTTAALKVLGDALGNPSPFVRNAAVAAISRFSGNAVLPMLLRASRDPEPGIARRAGRHLVRKIEDRPAALAEIREVTAEGIIELLDVRWSMEFLSDSYPVALRVLAARRLGRLGGEEATVALVSVAEAYDGPVRDACWRALEGCGQVSEHLLIPLLVNSDGTLRSRALQIYGRFADSHAEGLLSGFLQDPDPVVRQTALACVNRVAPDRAIDYARRAAKDKSAEVREHAVRLLTNMPDTAPDLLEAVQREKGSVRRIALTALANMGVVTPELCMAYMEFILQGSNTTDLSDQEYLDGLAAAARALGQAESPEGLLALTALVRSVIKRLRRIAIEGIMAYPPGDRSEALCSLEDAYDLDVLKNVAFGLHDAGDKRAWVPLIRASYECKGRPQLRARQLVEAMPQASERDPLCGCLKNRWPSVRRFGAEQLRKIRDASAIPFLLDASRDDDVEVQLAVFETLGIFATESEAVVERMLEAIQFGDITVRQMACESLGEARCAAAVPSLVKALHNPFLRPRATEALKRIGDRKGFLALKRLERREKMFSKKPKQKPKEKIAKERQKSRAKLDGAGK